LGVPAPPSTIPSASTHLGAKRLRNWVIAVVLAVAITTVVTALVVSFELSAAFGCGDGENYVGHGICIQDVLESVSAFDTSLPIMSATCPAVVAVNASFHCWVNVTSTASQPQNLSNISAGDAGNPFVLLSLSNPLPLTLAPGQVAVEELTIRSPNVAGAYNLLLSAQVEAPA